MIDDESLLVIEEARIEQVKNSAGPGDTIPGYELALMVHRQYGDAVARPDAEPFERARRPPRIHRNSRPARAADAAIGPPRDNLPSAMLPLGMIDQVRDAQRPV